MSRGTVVRGRCAIAGFVRVVSRALVGMQQKRRGVGVQWGAWVRVGWGSSRKAGSGFPALRRSVWVVWRAFGAVS